MSPPSAFLTVLRGLVSTHQAFLAYAAIHAHSLDLTTLPKINQMFLLRLFKFSSPLRHKL